MRSYFGDALVTGYRDLEPVLQCVPKDKHVLAAAVKSNAAILVTFIPKDFPTRSSDDFDLVVVHPDAFLQNQLGLFENQLIHVLEEQILDYRAPEMDIHELLDLLSCSGIPGFAEAVREKIAHI